MSLAARGARLGRRHWLGSLTCLATVCTALALSSADAGLARAATLPAGFAETIVFSGLTNPTAVSFSPDGRVFVAEKSGLVKVFADVNDPSPTIFADLRTNVHNFWDRGLLGLALDPNFPANPWVYVLYTYDHELGSAAPAPRWGTAGADSDGCPTPPGPTGDGCVVSGRLSRLQAAGDVMTGAEQVLIEGWCQQYPSHSVGSLAFGADGSLYVSGGEGASFTFTDYGQAGSPVNPCGDPPGPPGSAVSLPSAEGGALRSQDLRTTADPAGLDGAILRVDPATGAAVSSNPLAASTDPNARRIIAYGLRNPFRLAVRPRSNEIWIGDVGWSDWEELDVVADANDGVVENFGWPCYEGTGPQGGFDAANLSLCEDLYAAGPAAVTAPAYKYHHNERVVADESCPTGSSSLSGVAFQFYEGGEYPPEYDGALFFADHSRNCIWVAFAGADGRPDFATRRPFVAGAVNPVDLDIGPQGDLFYVDFEGGTIRRVRPVGASPTSCPVGSYLAEYFNNTTLAGTPAVTQCEPAVDGDWGAGAPVAGVAADRFSVRWTGRHSFSGGDYTFTVRTDDGMRLLIDGVAVIDQWADQSPTSYTVSRTLSAGEHEVRVEYYERTGDAVAQVGWQLIGMPTGCPGGSFLAQYFTNMTLSGAPVVSQCESSVSHAWGTGAPVEGIGADRFSVRWTGRHQFTAGAYTFTVRADDGVRLLVDGVALIDQWRDQAATSYTATRTLTAGEHEVRIDYYENTLDAVAQASWQPNGTANSPPASTITSPAATTTWKVGDAITFSGTGSDPEDGALPAAALSWSLVMNHCPSNCHEHLLQAFSGVASGTFTAPDHEYPSHLTLRLTATDSAGAQTTASVDLQPQTADLTFQSDPAGAQLAFNGVTATAPFTRTVIVGSANSISAPSPQQIADASYDFVRWSDGGVATHNINASASATSYVVTYRPSTVPATVHVGDLDGATGVVNRTSWRATVTITVHDASEAPVSGATVSASWTGGTKPITCTTDTSGRCTITAPKVPNTQTTTALSVTNVARAGTTYSSTSNHDADGDSSGTSITLAKPAP